MQFGKNLLIFFLVLYLKIVSAYGQSDLVFCQKDMTKLNSSL